MPTLDEERPDAADGAPAPVQGTAHLATAAEEALETSGIDPLQAHGHAPSTPALETAHLAATAAEKAVEASGIAPLRAREHAPSIPAQEAAHLTAAAEKAVETSGVDPVRARERALAVLDQARARNCREAESIAHRALGLAARELGHLTPAADHLHQAIAVAGDLAGRAAQARMSLVTVRADLGDPVGALQIADLAESGLDGLDQARLGVQRSVALVRLGRAREAVAQCDRAVERLSGAGDPRFLAGALLNRGLAHTYLEDYDAASRDLSACVAVARDAGLDHIATLAEANLPFVATRRGDIPAAFAGHQAAERALAGYPERLAAMRADFAGALLAAYLPGEARALLREAVPDLAATGSLVALAESRLLLAQVELLVGDPHQARVTAETAAGELAGQGRDAWVPLADEVTLRARIAVEGPSHRLAEEARALAARLAAHGWPAPAAALRLTAAELTLPTTPPSIPAESTPATAPLPTPTEPNPPTRPLPIPAGLTPAIGSPSIAAVPPASSGCADGEDAGPGSSGSGARATGGTAGRDTAPTVQSMVADDLEFVIDGPAAAGRAHRVVRHHALALRHSLGGDLAGAFSALREGLREAAAGSEQLSDPGVRAHALRAGERLAGFGLSLALRDGRADTVLGWAEHWRAVARGHAGEALSAERLSAELGGAALIELVRHDDLLAAVVVTAERRVLRRLGSYTAAAEATIRLRYGLRRAGLRDAGAGLCGVARESEDLAARLLAPLARDIGDRPAVIVPTGALHTLPWAALPPFRGRAICVAASAGAWLDAASRRPAPGHRAPLVAAVAGPGLEHARAEAAMVVRTYQEAACTCREATGSRQEAAHTGPETVPAYQEAVRTCPGTVPAYQKAVHTCPETIPACHDAAHTCSQTVPDHQEAVRACSGTVPACQGSVRVCRDTTGACREAVRTCQETAVRVRAGTADVLDALGRAEIVHIAAHGFFSARSPLLSRIALDDGPLMAYDLLGLGRTPWLAVLSACDAGMAHAPVDGTTLGLAGAFLDQDTACVIAGLVPVRDDEALALMTLLHGLLVRGHGPAEALAVASHKTGVQGFACFGSLGDPPPLHGT
ncbi:CHAT domain-containing protein [Sphaerisporangium dianthi]|uniref:CHAT domain-containing protein n=1 Tax=Sphaerisporangium dianthi TaxID=1436120 RepID=A0ABV9CFV5_9ACTN